MSENQSSSRRNTKKKWILIAVLAAIAIGAYYYWFSAHAYKRRGDELKEQGKIVEAMRNYAKAYDDNFDNFEYYQKKMVGSNEERIANYTKLIELEPQNAMYYCGRAKCYNIEKNYDAALDDYTKAIEIGGKGKNKYYEERGRFYSKMFDREHAMEDAKNSAKDKTRLVLTRLVDVLTNYGNSMPNNDQKCSDEAIFYYTKAIEVYDGMIHHTTSDSHLSDPHFNRGKVYEHLNNYSQAVADYAQVIKNGKIRIKQIETESAKLSSKVQELFGGEKSKDDALERVNKDMYVAYKLLGNVYKRNGDWANAIENYTNAIEVNEILASTEYSTAAWDLWKLYACRGECYSGQADYAKAVSDFTKAIENTSNDTRTDFLEMKDRSRCFRSRGYAYHDWGNTEKAKADFAAMWDKSNISNEEVVWLTTIFREGCSPIYAD